MIRYTGMLAPPGCLAAAEEFFDVIMKMDTLDADRVFGIWGCLSERQGRGCSDDGPDDADVDLVTAAEQIPGPFGGGLDLRYLVHQDRNWNVIALSDYDKDGTNAGVVVERYSLAT